MTQVLVVDDHDFFRGCLVDLVNASVDLEVVGECADGSEVEAAVAEVRPDIVVMDVRMGTVSGIDAARRLKEIGGTLRVIMLTGDTAQSSRAAARADGAAGYLIKGGKPDLVIDAIREVARGGTAWPDDPRPPHQDDAPSAGTKSAPGAVPPQLDQLHHTRLSRPESRPWSNRQRSSPRVAFRCFNL